MPDPSRSPATSITSEPERMAHAGWTDDRLISIQEIRTLFGLGRTAGYELTHRHGFPEPVVISPRCYRWWASEVTAFAASMRRQGPAPGRSGDDQSREDEAGTAGKRILGPHQRDGTPRSHQKEGTVTASVALDWPADRVVVEVAGGVTVYPARGVGGPVAGGVVRRRPPAAVRVGVRGGAGREAGEGH